MRLETIKADPCPKFPRSHSKMNVFGKSVEGICSCQEESIPIER